MISTKFFSNVEVVSFVGEAETIANETAPLNVVFSALRHLEVSVRNMKDQNWINLEFPHLTDLYTSLSGQQVPRFDEATIESVFEKNPQIQNVGTGFASYAFLNKTNVLLPNIETIIIGQFLPEDFFPVNIRFGNVKKLIISSNTAPGALEFPQLEEVVLTVLRPFDGNWIDYFGLFPTIKKINATVGGEIEAAQLLRLAEKLNKLEELAIVPDTNVMIDQVKKFIDNSKSLVKLYLVVAEERLIEDFNADNCGFIIDTFWNGSWGTITIDCEFRD